MTGLFHELKRRNVFRVSVAYVVVAWLLLQFSDLVLENVNAPDWVMQATMLLFAIGFPIAVLFAWAFELTPEGLKREKDVDRSQSITHVTGKKLDHAIMGIMGIAILLLLGDRFLVGDTSNTDEQAPASTGVSIAVLPFVNMSSDAEQEYFSDGITEEILNSLAKVSDLRVAGRTSSFAFKGENQDLRKIGEALSVDHILEGSVRKSGTTVRITAQLIQVEDGFHLWSESYDRTLNDVFAIQDEIATEILNQLKAKLLDEDLPVIQVARTDAKVYDLYLRARQRLYQRNWQTIQSAIELLDQAIELDPGYSPALAQRGIASLFSSEISYGDVPDEIAYAQGKRFLDRALENDPNNAEALAGMGLYLKDRPTRTDEAIVVLTRALKLNPSLIDASHWLQLSLSQTGNLAAAQQILEQMTERDPFFSAGFFSAVNNLNQLGRSEEARALIEHYDAYEPSAVVVVQAKAMQAGFDGNNAESARQATLALEMTPEDGVSRFWMDIGLAVTYQFDRLIEEGGANQFRMQALSLSGREDEAYDLAYELTEDFGPGAYFELLNRHGREKDVVEYVEERWPNLSDFAADHPYGSFGWGEMENIAYAYASTGDIERFDEAMLLLEAAMTDLTDQGVGHAYFGYVLARYYTLAGDYDRAIEHLAESIDQNAQVDVAFSPFGFILQPLSGDPRYEKIAAQMVANISASRAELGLGPAEDVIADWQ